MVSHLPVKPLFTPSRRWLWGRCASPALQVMPWGYFRFCSVCLICRFATLSRVIGFVVRSRIGTGIAPAALRGGTRRSDSHPRHYRSRCAVSVILHICLTSKTLPHFLIIFFLGLQWVLPHCTLCLTFKKGVHFAF